MPILATGNKQNGFTPLRRSAENGFTLVELMVVIAIIGIATSAVVLTMPASGANVRGEAETFAARAIAARDNAILQSRDMSVWVTADGYGASRRQHGAWQQIANRPFEAEHWKPGTTAIVDASGTQRAIFDTTGAVTTPVTFTLVRNSGRATIAISGDGVIRVGP
jgi:type II secretion system protein H